MSDIANKVETLMEAMPYLQKYQGKIIVIKYGGNAMINEELKDAVMHDVVLLKLLGMKPVLSHGGGPGINKMLEKLDIPVEFIEGLRYTSADIMRVVEMVLVGQVNTELVGFINKLGGKAVGLSGVSGDIYHCHQRDEVHGYVGDIVSVNGDMLRDMCLEDYIPVIASIGADENGDGYNINADIAACEIGGAVGADKLLFLTDIDGIRSDPNDPSTLIPRIDLAGIKKLMDSGAISGGMIPKVQSCVTAVRKGIKHVNIVNGTIPHSILVELFTVKGVGTLITE